MISRIFSDCTCGVRVNIATTTVTRQWFMPFNVFPGGLNADTPVFPFPAYKEHARTSALYPSSTLLNGWRRADGFEGHTETQSDDFEAGAYSNVIPESVTTETATARVQVRGSDTWTESLTEEVVDSDQLDGFAALVPWEDPLIFDLAHNLQAAFTFDGTELDTSGSSSFDACDQWIYVGNHLSQDLHSMAAMRINRPVSVYHFARSSALGAIAGCNNFGSDTPFAGPISVPAGDIIVPPDAASIAAEGGTHGYAAVNLAGIC